jgi:hypothetical protein
MSQSSTRAATKGDIDKLISKLDKLNDKVDNQHDAIERSTTELADLRKEVQSLRTELNAKNEQMQEMRPELDELRNQMQFVSKGEHDLPGRLERANNLVVRNIPKDVTDPTAFALKAICDRTAESITPADIIESTAFSKEGKNIVTLLIKLKDSAKHKKRAVFRHKVKMSKDLQPNQRPLYIDWDLTPMQRAHRNELWNTHDNLRNSGFMPFWQEELLRFHPKDGSPPQTHQGNFHAAARVDTPPQHARVHASQQAGTSANPPPSR